MKLKRGVSFLGERKYFSGACKTILLRGFFYHFKTTLLLFFSTNAYDFLCCCCFLCSEGTTAEYQKPNTLFPVMGCEGVGLIIFFTLLNVRNYGMVLLTFVFCDSICSPFFFSQECSEPPILSYINNLGFLGLFQFLGCSAASPFSLLT